MIPAFQDLLSTIQPAKLFVLLDTLLMMKISVKNVHHNVPPVPTMQTNVELVVKDII